MSDTPEFPCTCTGLVTPCIGCRANAAVVAAVQAERERIAAATEVEADRLDGFNSVDYTADCFRRWAERIRAGTL